MSTSPFNLDICTPPRGRVRVLRLNVHEWWAGESLDGCVAEAARAWGFSGEDFADSVEDAYESPDADVDTLNLTTDDQRTKQTFREALSRMRAEQICFPALFAGRE